jgi:hemerythrin-like domain-containing protein
LTGIVTDSGASRATAFGRQLIETHNWLRAQLAAVRESLVDGSAPPHLRDLRVHCLSFCTALTRHHTGEDDVAFPVLATEVPELAGVIAKLRQDHDMVTTLLAGFQSTLADPDATPKVILSHLDGLAAIVESHFSFEERKIAAALDELREPGWGQDPAFLTRR